MCLHTFVCFLQHFYWSLPFVRHATVAELRKLAANTNCENWLQTFDLGPLGPKLQTRPGAPSCKPNCKRDLGPFQLDQLLYLQ